MRVCAAAQEALKAEKAKAKADKAARAAKDREDAAKAEAERQQQVPWLLQIFPRRQQHR